MRYFYSGQLMYFLSGVDTCPAREPVRLFQGVKVGQIYDRHTSSRWVRRGSSRFNHPYDEDLDDDREDPQARSRSSDAPPTRPADTDSGGEDGYGEQQILDSDARETNLVMLATAGTRRNIERDARGSFHESIPVAHRAHAPSRLESAAARATLEVRHFDWHAASRVRLLRTQQDLDAEPSIGPVALTMETEEIFARRGRETRRSRAS